jgi:hypothetical protein
MKLRGKRTISRKEPVEQSAPEPKTLKKNKKFSSRTVHREIFQNESNPTSNEVEQLTKIVLQA